MFKAILIATTLLATIAQTDEAYTLSYGEPEDVGLSQGVLKGALSLYQESVARGEVVGAVILIARHGRVVAHQALGWSNKEKSRPMERSTLFHMASNTKPVVAAGIAKLVEQGNLSYSSLVRDYISEWDNYRAGHIQIEHLLTHTSGFRIRSLFLPFTGQETSLREEVARFGSIGAEVSPGTSYSYSNPGYNSLGALIEIASENSLEDYLDEFLYTPLGMDDSYNNHLGHALEGKTNRVGPVYYQKDAGGEWKPEQPTILSFARASGGMVSSTWDYAVFCQMMLNRGIYNNQRLLKPETVDAMLSAKVKTPRGAYGYGWMLDGPIAYHGGSDGTDAWIDRQTGVIGLVFTQTPNGRPSIKRFRQLINLAIDPVGK